MKAMQKKEKTAFFSFSVNGVIKKDVFDNIML